MVIAFSFSDLFSSGALGYLIEGGFFMWPILILGILGTVLGIITAFDVLGGGGIDDPIEVTGGIAEALLTTAAGLVVAITALLPYTYFSARMEDAVGELEAHLTPLESSLERQVGA